MYCNVYCYKKEGVLHSYENWPKKYQSIKVFRLKIECFPAITKVEIKKKKIEHFRNFSSSIQSVFPPRCVTICSYMNIVLVMSFYKKHIIFKVPNKHSPGNVIL